MADAKRGKTQGKSVGEASALRGGLIAALDIGSSKIACLIGRAEGGQVRIIGSALRASRGMRAGAVVALAEVVASIDEALDAAETMAGVRVQNVLIGVNGGHPISVSARAFLSLNGALVKDSHLRALIAEGRSRCLSEGYEIIQSTPTGYVVDEARGVRDPSGMYCQRLGVTMHAVAVQPSPLMNLRLAVERSHLAVGASLFAPYASALAVLSDDERQLGATVIDMGGGCTSLAVFMEGHLAHVDVLPMGGVQVTADLARMLATPLSAAERAKVLYGAALGDLESGAADVVAVPQMGEEDEENALRVPRSMLTRIIQARVEEIFSEVQTRLRSAGFDVVAGRRAVLTGGASQLAGVRELAARILNKQVRLGRPCNLPGLPDAASGPDYACAVGLLMAGASLPPEQLNPEIPLQMQESGAKGWWSRLTGGLFG